MNNELKKGKDYRIYGFSTIEKFNKICQDGFDCIPTEEFKYLPNKIDSKVANIGKLKRPFMFLTDSDACGSPTIANYYTDVEQSMIAVQNTTYEYDIEATVYSVFHKYFGLIHSAIQKAYNDNGMWEIGVPEKLEASTNIIMRIIRKNFDINTLNNVEQMLQMYSMLEIDNNNNDSMYIVSETKRILYTLLGPMVQNTSLMIMYEMYDYALSSLYYKSLNFKSSKKDKQKYVPIEELEEYLVEPFSLIYEKLPSELMVIISNWVMTKHHEDTIPELDAVAKIKSDK